MKLNKRLITGLIGGVLVLAVVGVLISGAAKKRAAQAEADMKIALQNSPRPVKTEWVEALSVEKERGYPGVVNASDESALSFRVDGPLVQVNVTLGELVKKGDLLMQIDPRDFEDRIQSLDAQLAGAAAQQQNASQDYARMSKLFAQQVVPQRDYDHAKNTMDSADAVVKNIKAQLAIARHALKDTSLLAPYDGVVTEQLAENSEMVDSGDVVLQFHNIQLLEVTVSVPENEIVRRSVGKGTFVQVSFPAVAGRTFDARLKEWSSAADPLTRTYAITFEFDAPADLKILPGMTADVSWRSARPVSVMTVPVSALSPGADGSSFVWVCGESGAPAVARPVTVGELIGTSRVVILDGVSEGEQVIVSGNRLIHKNIAVEITQE